MSRGVIFVDADPRGRGGWACSTPLFRFSVLGSRSIFPSLLLRRIRGGPRACTVTGIALLETVAMDRYPLLSKIFSCFHSNQGEERGRNYKKKRSPSSDVFGVVRYWMVVEREGGREGMGRDRKERDKREREMCVECHVVVTFFVVVNGDAAVKITSLS